jgi:hypothetical protein
MATTDTRSGFRLPWSSDRSQDDQAGAYAVDGIPESAARPKSGQAWPESDFLSRADSTATDTNPADDPEAAQEAPSTMIDQQVSAPRRPQTKLMADLAAAIRATTEAARDQRLGQLEAEAGGIVELIRAQSEEGAVALRRRSDEDVTAIRDWAKAEIARIKEESEARIADRKQLLEQEVADHAAAIEDRVGEVHTAVAGYREAMDAYFARLQAEEDPARLATMAEGMPDAPALERLAELEHLEITGAAARHATSEAVEETSAELVTADVHSSGAGSAAEVDWPTADDAPRWSAEAAPEGFPEPAQGGDPVDRGAIMAALEAAAEAVVAAEAAAESAESAEAAADVAETAAELLSGRAGQTDELDPEAQAAMAARMDAGGFDTESYQDRLASLMPGHPEADPDGEPRTTQVVVSGLVSVASIASFKRHLGRLPGVTAVSVSSGPDGEFIFSVNHRPDASFRDAIPTMPGFAARVTAAGDGVVSVTAHDPEAEG